MSFYNQSAGCEGGRQGASIFPQGKCFRSILPEGVCYEQFFQGLSLAEAKAENHRENASSNLLVARTIFAKQKCFEQSEDCENNFLPYSYPRPVRPISDTRLAHSYRNSYMWSYIRDFFSWICPRDPPQESVTESAVEAASEAASDSVPRSAPESVPEPATESAVESSPESAPDSAPDSVQGTQNDALWQEYFSLDTIIQILEAQRKDEKDPQMKKALTAKLAYRRRRFKDLCEKLA